MNQIYHLFFISNALFDCDLIAYSFIFSFKPDVEVPGRLLPWMSNSRDNSALLCVTQEMMEFASVLLNMTVCVV